MIVTAHVHLYTRLKQLDNEFIPHDYPKDNKTVNPVQLVVGHSGTIHYFVTSSAHERLSVALSQTVYPLLG